MYEIYNIIIYIANSLWIINKADGIGSHYLKDSDLSCSDYHVRIFFTPTLIPIHGIDL